MLGYEHNKRPRLLLLVVYWQAKQLRGSLVWVCERKREKGEREGEFLLSSNSGKATYITL